MYIICFCVYVNIYVYLSIALVPGMKVNCTRGSLEQGGVLQLLPCQEEGWSVAEYSVDAYCVYIIMSVWLHACWSDVSAYLYFPMFTVHVCIACVFVVWMFVSFYYVDVLFLCALHGGLFPFLEHSLVVPTVVKLLVLIWARSSSLHSWKSCFLIMHST